MEGVSEALSRLSKACRRISGILRRWKSSLKKFYRVGNGTIRVLALGCELILQGGGVKNPV